MTREEGIAQEIVAEVTRARTMFKPIGGPHEALGVILEEFEEFKDEVKKYNPRKGRDTRPQMREELIQLAAMAIRAVIDVAEDEQQCCSMYSDLNLTEVPFDVLKEGQ